MTVASHTRLVCIPSDDIAFREAVLAIVDRTRARDASAFQDALRCLFPDARISVSVLADETLRWYCYRDTHHGSLGDPTWRHARSAVRFRLDHEGTIIAVNSAFARLFETRSPVVGRPFADFLLPENRVAHDRQSAALLRGEVLHSIARGRTATGRDLVFEYVGRLDADEVRVWCRPVAAPV